MKRIVAILLLCALSVSAWAQDLRPAENAFKRGQYDDAKQLYETTASMIQDASKRQQIYDLAKKCTKCKTLLEKANRHFKNHLYPDARNAYQELLANNPSDPTAKANIARIPELIELDKKDQALWASVASHPTEEGYRQYLAAYPNGLHQEAARSAIKNIKAEQARLEQKKKEELARLERQRKEDENAYRTFASSREIDKGVNYLKKYPNGNYVKEAKSLLVELYCEEHEYDEAMQYTATLGDREFVRKHNLDYRRKKNAAAEEKAYQVFERNKTQDAAKTFLAAFPDGYHGEEVSGWLMRQLYQKDKYDEARKYACNTALKEELAKHEEEYTYAQLTARRTLTQEKIYLESFPKGKHYDDVRSWYVADLIAANSFAEARKFATQSELSEILAAEENYCYNQFKSSNALLDGQAYLEQFPNGRYEKAVRKKVVQKLCDDGLYWKARQYAAPSPELNRYVEARENKAAKNYAFDAFSDHFVDFSLGYNRAESYFLVGLSYSYVPRRIGFYLEGLAGLDRTFGGCAGPVFRLTNDDSSVDWQLYGGAGYFDEGILFDAGMRFGMKSSLRFSLFDLNLGCKYFSEMFVPYIGISIGFPVALFYN